MSRKSVFITRQFVLEKLKYCFILIIPSWHLCTPWCRIQALAMQGKKNCEVTGEGEGPDSVIRQCFPTHCRGTASSHPDCTGMCFTNTSAVAAHPQPSPQLFSDSEQLTRNCFDTVKYHVHQLQQSKNKQTKRQRPR